MGLIHKNNTDNQPIEYVYRTLIILFDKTVQLTELHRRLFIGGGWRQPVGARLGATGPVWPRIYVAPP